MMRWMGNVLMISIYLIVGLCQINLAQSPGKYLENKGKKIHADLIVLKFKTPVSSNGRVSFSPESGLKKLKEIVDYEDHHQVFTQKSFSNARVSASSLQNIYKLKLKPGSNLWRELARLEKLDFIEYAEPFFQNELLFIPNDPQADPNGGLQDYLTVIKAYEGWQIDQSDSSIVIGIVDTGVNMNHEDLGNVAYNYADPVNGLDDDDDGYIDNFYGWDISDNDNDPIADGHPHGTPVAGMSAATTNNGIGMAGIGFKSKYLPVKIAETSSQLLTHEYEGVVYAADHGCKVINLSWGGIDNYSKYGQDIINYAVLEKNVVVVAAAGNTHDELNFYPASFDNVLSVGATDINDNLASWATYSHNIDIMAPGDNVYSTKNNGGYEKTTGSSFASPMVAGAAALVRSHFPELSAIQVMEQLRVTSDDIYQVGSNMDFYGKLGRGRLNVQKALSEAFAPSIRISDFQYESNHGGLIFPGDTLDMQFIFTNYLREAENVNISISNPSDNVALENDHIYIDKLGESESFQDDQTKISLIVNQDVQPGERLIFRFDFSGNNYTDFQYIEIGTTPGYFDVSDGKLTATIYSDGDIGFDSPMYGNGKGVSYNGELIASHSGLIISLDSIHVMDNVINNYSEFSRDEDFISETNARLYDNSIADYDARSVFKPSDTIASSLDIKIEQKILAWENATDDGYLIFEYRIINTGDSALTGINAGLFADWDLGNYESNAAAWDEADDFSYVYEKSSNNLYSGMSLLTEQTKSYYAIDLKPNNGNTADVDSLFDDEKKHNFLSTATPKTQAGSQGDGNDVAHIVGGKGITLEPNQSVKVTFAMLASSSLDGLRSALESAKSNYAAYLNDPPLAQTFYACVGESVLIDPKGEIYEFYSDVALTQKLDSGRSFETEPVIVDQTYYTINLDSGYAGDVMKMIASPGTPTAEFTISTDTLVIENGMSASVTFENNASLGDQWHWDFSNGYSSTVENPSTSYDKEGLYTIELIASNVYGCADSIKKDLLVAIQPERAIIEDQHICKGTKTVLFASNSDHIKVYKEKELTEVLFEGDEFITEAITSDTVFYIVNINGPYESVATQLNVFVNHPEVGFQYKLDTINLDEKHMLNVYNTKGETDSLFWFVDGVYKSNDAAFDFVYPDIPFNLAQVKIDAEGCSDTVNVSISPAYSILPSVENLEVCKKTDAIIQPGNGEVFYFYEDEGLNKLLHKGKSMLVQQISSPHTYFVTGMDGLLESASTSIRISLNPVTAIIEASADTIDLVTENQVVLSDQSINSTNSFWLMSTGTFDTTRVLTETYDVPGVFQYTLVAEGSDNCFDTTYQSIRIVSITGIQKEGFSELKIYPNPVSNVLNIDLGEKIDHDLELEMIDSSGRRLKSFKIYKDEISYKLSLESLKKGIYFIRSINTAHPFLAKVLKQ